VRGEGTPGAAAPVADDAATDAPRQDICEHRKIRTCCAACGGRQICPHGVRLYVCRTCEGGGGAFCTHGRVRNTCRLCNPQHPMHGVVARVGSNGTLRASVGRKHTLWGDGCAMQVKCAAPTSNT
jgi:hypothetical protein